MARLLGAGQQKSSSSLLCVSFNQDASCISVGTRKGYSIWNAEPHGRVYSKNTGPTSIVEMLFCTSLVALVGTADSNQPHASPRRLQIVNTKRQSTICELLFPTAILGVKLNRRRLVVILEEEIYIYDISNMKLLHTIETSPNPQAICALSASSDPCYLVYPSPVPSPNSPLSSNGTNTTNTPGDVMIFDLLTLSVTNIIQAHKTPISALSLNQNGTLLATSSDKGTVIRVFSVPSAKKLWQFRRGSYPARIYSLSFNSMSTLLCCSSDTETVHIFKLLSSSSSKSDTNGKNGASAAARSAALSAAAPPVAGGSPGSPSIASVDGSDSPSDGGQGGVRGGYEAFIDDPNRKKGPGAGAGPGGGFSGSLRRRSWALGKNVAGSVGGFLPNTLSEMWEPQRDFAYLKLPSPGVSSLVAVSSSTPTVMVVTSEGYFYSYNIDLETGGECVLMKQYSLLDAGEDSDER